MKKRSKAKKRSRLVKRHHVRASKSVTLARKDDIVTEVVDEEKRIALLDSDGFMTLGQAQEYWLLGEWGKLTTFDLAFLKKHPDRGRLALLIGSAYQQLTKRDEARKYVREALKWGCSRTEVVKTLLAGVYNVLGRFLALKGEKKEAISFFEKSILCDFISVVDKSLSGELRMASQLRQLNIVVFLFYKKKKNNIINFDCIDDHKKIDVRQLVVLGMHRSGTSCVTGSFHNMGAYFASGENIMSPSLSNPKGFFERIDTMKLNDQALSKSHATWWQVSKLNLNNISTVDLKLIKEKYRVVLEELNKESLWIIKDPRFCLVLPLFDDLFNNPVFIHVYRNPVEVALSLNKRNGFPMSFGLALWEFYNKKALSHSKGMPKVQILYNDLIENSANIFLGLKKHFYDNFKIDLKINEEDLSESSFVDKNLYRNRISEHEMDEWLTTSQRLFWEMLEQGIFLDKDYHVPPISKVCMETLENYELYRKSI